MFAVRKVAQVSSRASRLAVQQRGNVSGPPKVRISFPEKVAHGVVIAAGVIATPLWVLHHVREYIGNTDEEEE